MTRLERKLLLINGLLGTGLTLLVLLLDWGGQMQALERWFYDRRALYCQFFAKPPTDRLVYVDIDDNSINTIGRWPWDRSDMAGLIEEIAAARPKLIFLDILYSESQTPTLKPQSDGGWLPVEQDPPLAAAIQRAGNVLVPLEFDFMSGREHDTPAERAMLTALLEDLEQTPEALAARLKARGIAIGGLERSWADRFLRTREAAMYERVDRIVAAHPDISPTELRQQVLPKLDQRQVDSPLLRLLSEQLKRVRKLRPLEKFLRDRRPGDPPFYPGGEETAPIEMFSQAAGGTAFVNYIPDAGDGVVRRIPLFVEHRGKVVPQTGLVIACRLLGADPLKAEVSSESVSLSCPNGRVVNIPVRVAPQTDTGELTGALLNIPYFGGRDWQTMYDPHRKDRKQHVPMNVVWQVIQTRRSIAFNNATADRALLDALQDFLGEEKAKEFAQKKLGQEDAATRLSWMRDVLDVVGKFLDQYKYEPKLTAETLKPFAALKIAEQPYWVSEILQSVDALLEPLKLTEDDAKQLAALKNVDDGMRALIAENQRLTEQLKRQRANLTVLCADRAVLVGSIATAMAEDLKPTPLHDICPGVVIHGVVANGILTGELWRTAPLWITRLLTLFSGLATTGLVLRLRTTRAATAAVTLAVVYLLVNGIVVFDYFNIIVGVAGPIVAMLLTWLSCQLVEVLVEKAERRRITRRFQSYVDPKLVEYVINHPELDVMGGHVREMTVVFTDLAGFTTISETLKEKVIPLLNEYLGMMAAIIRKHHGLVNKFLGDGIMFFYNAPDENPNHAGDAIATVLDMQEALVGFNEQLEKRGLPRINMRAGITTGPMVVGDAGSKDSSDYTVIGDNVNLAARLESANKATGTKVLMTSRTAEMLGERYLVRPAARLQVKGKKEGVDTCVLVARAADATDEQRRFTALWKRIFDAYVRADFAVCLRAIEELESAFGDDKLARAYRELCDQYLKEPPTNGFDGHIVLHEK